MEFSNGGGRSGAFLALDANLELMQRTGQIDVYEYAKTLVNSRQHLIESVDQYTFLYDALCEAVMCNLQPIEMHQLKERSTMYKSKKDRELMELQISHENKVCIYFCDNLETFRNNTLRVNINENLVWPVQGLISKFLKCLL